MAEDPALLRNAHLHERTLARQDIAIAVTLIGAAVGLVLLAMFTNDVMLLVGTFGAPTLLFFAFKRLTVAFGRHAYASLKLHQLHARDTGLPPARIVDK